MFDIRGRRTVELIFLPLYLLVDTENLLCNCREKEGFDCEPLGLDLMWKDMFFKDTVWASLICSTQF